MNHHDHFAAPRDSIVTGLQIAQAALWSRRAALHWERLVAPRDELEAIHNELHEILSLYQAVSAEIHNPTIEVTR